jgi:hypothetical protein
MDLPLKVFWDLLRDLAIITGNEKYDENRNKKTIDSEELAKATG